MNKLAFGAPLMLLGALAVAAAPALATPIKKQPKTFTKGTSQMPGGYGAFGQTYTLSSNGTNYNFTLTSAEYTIEPYNVDVSNNDVADADHKLLVIHYRLKNPNSGDLYISSSNQFQCVDSNGNTINDLNVIKRESEKQGLSMTLKPGQGVDDLMEAFSVPAHGAIGKIIVEMGQAGTSDTVFRYELGKAPNVVKPLTAPYVDTSDPSGATALDSINATVGTKYICGAGSISVDNIALAPGPFGSHTADDGKQYLVATVTLTNLEWAKFYHPNSQIQPTLSTTDGDVTDYFVLKATHDEDYDDATLGFQESTIQRLVLEVDSKDPGLKTLSILFDMGDSGKARPLVYDVSNLK